MRYEKMILGIALGMGLAATAQVKADTATFDFANPLSPNYVNVIGTSPFFQNLPDAPLQTVTASGGFLTQLPVLGLGVGLDGAIDPGQAVNFGFSQAVNVQSVTFTAFLNVANGGFFENLGDNATFQFTGVGGTVTTVTPTIVSFDAISDRYTLSGTAATDGTDITSFTVKTHDLTDSFGIGGLSVNYTPTLPTGGGTPPVVTPLPAAASSGLAMLAIAGAAALMRRRRAVAV